MIESLGVEPAFDESGDTGTARGASHYLIVAGVICEQIGILRRVVALTRRTLRGKQKLHPEMKGHGIPERLTRRMLKYLAAKDVEIIAVILDKRAMPPMTDPERNPTPVDPSRLAPRARNPGADAVAWALFQQYEHGLGQYRSLIVCRIVAEVMLP